MSPTSTFPANKSRYRSSITSKSNLQNQRNKNRVEVQETNLGFHYELKIPGYVKEDFNFYIKGDNLVVTTDRSHAIATENLSDNKKKHSYCYPSAYFKMDIPLPQNVVRDRISVNYVEEILSFDLFKL